MMATTEIQVKERPVLMSAPMVRATLNVKPNVWPAEPIDASKPFKWQTRRIVKPQPPENWEPAGCGYVGKPAYWTMFLPPEPAASGWADTPDHTVTCPYGKIGDRLWVRETWAAGWYQDDHAPRELNSESTPIWYQADNEPEIPPMKGRGKWRPSIFMPRWASRITLETVDVCVERLQDISEEDANAEGMYGDYVHTKTNEVGSKYQTVREQYRELWDKINGAGAWDLNSWVWCISFKRVA